MLRGLCRVLDGPEALPFVRMFYGQASVYLWEDDEGIVHDIHQGEGGEQGDALMPLLFSLGLHPAFQAVQAQLLARRKGVRIFGRCVRHHHPSTGWRHLPFVRTRIVDPCQHPGPWRGRQLADELERISRAVNGGNVWRGSQVPSAGQGIKVLGSPLGHTDFVDAHLERTTREHSVLLERIPSVLDLTVCTVAPHPLRCSQGHLPLARAPTDLGAQVC